MQRKSQRKEGITYIKFLHMKIKMDQLQTCLPATIFLIISLGNLLLSMEDGKLNVSAIPYIVMYAGILQLLCTYNHTGLAWGLLIFLGTIPILLLTLAIIIFLIFGKDIEKWQNEERKGV